jgi:putative membrane protein
MHCWGLFGNTGGTGMITGMIISTAILVGLIVLVVWSVRRLSYRTTSGPQDFNPGSGKATVKEIIQSRYARGELTREQYQQMLADIEGQ